MKTAIGIDIGGTKIAAAIGDEKGRVLSQFEIPTEKGSKAPDCVEKLIAAIETTFSKNREVQGIGAALPGAVNPHSGKVPRSPHMKGWTGLPLKKILSSRFKLPVRMANDANAAAVGEMRFGAGRGISDFVYLTISTGIGGGLVVHGRLVEGHSFAAGEVGHMAVVPKGEICGCGRQGCLEAYASGTAMALYAEYEIKRGRKSKMSHLLKRGGRLNGKVLGAAAAAGDLLALEAYCRGGYYLGIGIANLLNLLNPERVILGGGVLKSAPSVFWQEMIRTARRQGWPEAHRGARIMRSKLGDRSEILGAIALGLEAPIPQEPCGTAERRGVRNKIHLT